MSLCYFLYAGAEQTELFYSMTEFAKEACKAAHNTLLVHCDQVAAGDVTLCDMRILKQNETTVDQLCTATCIRGFSLRKWLGRLEDIERYIANRSTVSRCCFIQMYKVCGDLLCMQLRMYNLCSGTV